MTIDITKHINQEGPYQVTMLSEAGQRTLTIQSVALLQNEREVMRDTRKGWSDGRGIYAVTVAEHAFGTQYVLKIRFTEKNYKNNACNIWIMPK